MEVDNGCSMRLPIKLIGLVAKHLIAMELYGTCASLSLANKSVRAAILPILYKTMVSWPASLYKKVGSSCWGTARAAQNKSRAALKKQVTGMWEVMKESEGREYVEILVLPPFVMAGGATLFHGLDDIPFNNARVIVSTMLGEDRDGRPQIPLVTNILRSCYEFGGNDLHQLTQTLTKMGEIGGIEVQKALNSPKGTHVMAPAYSSTKLPSVEDTDAKLAANPLPPNIFRPRTIAMGTLGEKSPDAMALTLVEVLHWMKLELDPTAEGMPRSTVVGDLTFLDTVEECVRALRTLSKTKPDIAKLIYAFEFDPAGDMDYTVLISQTKAILAIVRAIFIRACRHMPVTDIGIFVMNWHSDEMGDFCWTVQAGSEGDCIETTLDRGGEIGILFRDTLKP